MRQPGRSVRRRRRIHGELSGRFERGRSLLVPPFDVPAQSGDVVERAGQSNDDIEEAGDLERQPGPVIGVPDPNWMPIRWLESGAGTPVVFIHGLPTSPMLWRHVVAHLADARCLAFEMVVHGESIPAGRDRDISLAAQADYLLRWLDFGVGLERTVLVGHGVGAGVAQIVAVKRPAVCSGLILISPVGYDLWPVSSVRALQGASSAIARLPGVALYGVLGPLVIRGHDHVSSSARSLVAHVGPYRRHGGGGALARQLRSLDSADTMSVQDGLSGLNVPVRVLCGTGDDPETIRCAQRLAADLGATLLRLDGGRHFTPEDRPEVVVAQIRSLINDIGANAGA